MRDTAVRSSRRTNHDGSEAIKPYTIPRRGAYLRACTARVVPVKAEVDAMVAAIVLTGTHSSRSDVLMQDLLRRNC